MTKLNDKQLKNKIKFIEDYINAKNAADEAIHDPNANIDNFYLNFYI